MHRMRLLRLPTLLLLLCLLLSLLGTSCSSSFPTASSVLQAICTAEGSIPAGSTHLLFAPDGVEVASQELLCAAFGMGELPPELDLLQDGAFYFGISEPYECSVFLCKNASQAEAIAKMCLRRAQYLKNYWKDHDAFAYVQSASVTVKGCWVLLCISPTQENAVRAFCRAV